MSSEPTEENTHSEQLRNDYKGAFSEWALQVSRLKEVAQAASDCGVVKEAAQRAAEAELAYRDSRDRLTDDMGWTPK